MPSNADIGIGVNGTLTWTHTDQRSDIVFSYTGDYSARVRYSAWNALNHLFSMTARRHLAPRWDLGFTAGVNVTTADRLAFLTMQPSPAAISPSLLLYGDRMLGASAQVSLTHRFSGRTSIAWLAGGTRYQSLTNNDTINRTDVGAFRYQSTMANAGLRISYSLSPRTEIAADVGINRQLSGFLDAWYENSSVSINHAISEHWFLGARGGAGFIRPVRGITNVSTTLGYLAGATIGYRTPAQTFRISTDRSVGDSYGLGTASTISSTAIWNWRRPGRPWFLQTSLGRQQFEGGAFGRIHTWNVAFSAGRSITTDTVLSAEYGYMRYSAGLPIGTIAPNSVRVAMIWRPRPGLLR